MKGLEYNRQDYDDITESLISRAHEEGYDLSVLSEGVYDTMQTYEIIAGIQSGVDVKKYAFPYWHYLDMHEVRLRLEAELISTQVG